MSVIIKLTEFNQLPDKAFHILRIELKVLPQIAALTGTKKILVGYLL